MGIGEIPSPKLGVSPVTDVTPSSGIGGISRLGIGGLLSLDIDGFLKQE